MIKTILTGFVLGLILILFIPATLILASWNAVPGDSVYSVKVGLEKAILGVTPSDNLKTTLEIKYTERRFNEVEKLITTKTTNSSKDITTKLINTSLTNLTNQAIASKNSLQKIQNSDEKIAQTESLIAALESISSKIEEQKQTSNTSSIPTKNPTKIPTKVPTNIPTIIKPDITLQPIIADKPSPTLTPFPTSIPTKTPTPIENNQPIDPPDLDDTIEIIGGIIDELKAETSTQSTSDNNNDKSTSRRDKNDSSENNNDNKDKNKDSKDRNDRRP